MQQDLSLQFESSVSELTDINESFSSGRVLVCYTGKNRNKTDISKESIERAIPSMFNCPVVCNYNVESNEIGGHDMDVVSDADGNLKLINLTAPVGVIPSGAKYGWEIVKDGDDEHEYFYSDAILWKRSPAYQKIAEDKITGQSMEITVKDGVLKDGYFTVNDFIFTAFCLLGENVTPCFESASLQMFSIDNNANAQFNEMMADYKKAFSCVDSSSEVHINDSFREGGNVMEQKNELLAKYGVSAESLAKDIESYSVEELEDELKGMNANFADESGDDNTGESDDGGEDTGVDGQSDAGQESGSDAGQGTGTDTGDAGGSGTGGSSGDVVEDDGDDDVAPKKKYALSQQVWDEVCTAVENGKDDENKHRYWPVDYDADAGEVYFIDAYDYKLYGMNYAMNGDAVVVDWSTMKRKKYVVADFVDGDADNVSQVYQEISNGAVAEAEQKCAEKYSDYSVLVEFKNTVEAERVNAEKATMFASFADLNGIDEFETLKTNAANYSVGDIENHCYMIRGKNVVLNFSAEPEKRGAPKLPAGGTYDTAGSADPYGGLFQKYNIQ